MPELDFRAISVARLYECPDCNAEIRLEVDAFGIHHLHVYHDDTCPWLASGGAGS